MMIYRLLRVFKCFHIPIKSKLYDQSTFYNAFFSDLKHAKQLVYIESPFITLRRTDELMPYIVELRSRGVQVKINTRFPDEHNAAYEQQALIISNTLQEIGVVVLYTVKLHRKIAIVDDILWEGSLNIFSHNDSCEIMRRSNSLAKAKEMFEFIST